MRFAYEIKNGCAVVRRCYDFGNEAEIPSEIDGHPVTELGAYAFSAHMDREQFWHELGNRTVKIWNPETGEQEVSEPDAETVPGLQGMQVETVRLPEGLRKIGAYAFYNCNALSELHFHSSLKDLGAGLFTGCHHLRRLNVTLDETETSCLKEILIEVPEKMAVTVEGQFRAKLLFPEFFEESVENTPARILMTHMHGSGMNFRNSFYMKKLDFRAYDACYYMAKAEEDFDTVLEMTLNRLQYPVGLSEDRREDYESWLNGHLVQAFEKAVEHRDLDMLMWLTEHGKPDDGLLSQTAIAAADGFPEGVAYLQNRLSALGHTKKQSFLDRFEL